MLISLRGTNGSGKGTVINAFFAENKAKPIHGILGPRLPEAYEVRVAKVAKPVFVLGPYQVPTGGCDRILPFDLIPEMITRYAKRGHVLFEGVIVSSVYGQVGKLMEGYKDQAVMLFLDTPLEVCVERVGLRRGKRADSRPFDSTNLARKYHACQRIKARAEKEKLIRVMEASSEQAHKVITKLLRSAK